MGEIKKEWFRDRMGRGLKSLNIPYSDEQLEQLFNYLLYLKSENKKYNLTAITEPEEIITKHFLDSLVIIPELPDNKHLRWLDIGTGGGFPGLVLKIFRPGEIFYLVDSVRKKVDFLKMLAAKIDIKGVEAFHARAENLAHQENWRAGFDLVVSRAVAPLNVLLEYTVPFVELDGQVILYKGPEYENELEEAKEAMKLLGANLSQVKKVDILGIKGDRVLLYINKEHPTPDKYPRRPGMPKKRPL